MFFIFSRPLLLLLLMPLLLLLLLSWRPAQALWIFW
jgi:hypothetical protein